MAKVTARLIPPSSGPVSYTHLDVYKRQESLAKKGLISEEVSAMLTQALEVTVSPENTPTLNAEVAEAISEYSHQVGYGQMMPEEAAKGLYEDLTRLLKKIKP